MAYCRRLCTALLGLSAALWASPGLAQTSTSITTSTATTALAASDFTLKLQSDDSGSWSDLSTTDAATYLNQARCQCAWPVQILVQMAAGSVSKLSSLNVTGTSARLYVGTDCATLNAANQPNCPNGLLGSLPNIANLSAGSWTVQTTVDKLFGGAGVGNSGAIDCRANQNTTIWLWLDSTGTGQPDQTVNGSSSAPNLGIALDGAPPTAPTDIKVEGGEEALMVSWGSVSTTDSPDLAGYLVFCMRGSDLQVFVPSYYNGSVTSSGDGSADVFRPTSGSQYLTGQILCSATPPSPTPAGVSSADPNDDPNNKAIEIGAPLAFEDLDPNYLCSGLLPTTKDSIRIGGLQNGIPYQVGVASVDTHGNASSIQSAFVQRPVPTIDFYQAYRQAGGQSPGGYCSLAGRGVRFGAISFLAGSGFLALLIIFRRRRRARRALSRSLPFLLVALAAGSAQAQSVTHEETDEMSSEQRGNYRTPKEWAMELRFGPYRPDVDSGIGSAATATYNGAPYKAVFGSKRHLMSQLEFDWQFFQTFGSLAVGAAIGYYKVSAQAFTADATGNCVLDSNGVCTRSGDTTSLRLIPVAALLVYRWDVAAARWSIPFVPYVKLGLNYTFWQVNDGNGNVPSYAGGHGSGGTLGWQAAAGMSLLLDILDSDAARGLDMEAGVNHSYVFFEWNSVDASGLGMSNKLHVGDSRWVLGLMFEF